MAGARGARGNGSTNTATDALLLSQGEGTMAEGVASCPHAPNASSDAPYLPLFFHLGEVG